MNSTDFDTPRLRRRLLAWFDREQRAMPWRESRDPYRVWVSEIMLQQTQVATVVPYFERFMERFPSLVDLARADEDDALALWAGLGYYTRARNLLKAARRIAELGAFPSTYDELLRLPGFGPYTAAAVASIVFDEAVACVDGNVMRVVARLLALDGDPRKGETKKTVEQTASDWIDPKRPGDFNQAMMELGATVCQRDTPYCLLCPVRDLCRAHEMGIEADIPPRRPSKTEPLTAVIGVCRERGRVLVSRRREGGRFAGMWEFPGGKVEAGETLEDAVAREFLEEVGIEVEATEKLAVIKHAYTRFRVTLHCFGVRRLSGKAKPLEAAEVKWTRLVDLTDYAFPAANKRLIEILSMKRC